MNPLLEKFNTKFETSPFSKIKEEHFLPAIKESIIIAKNEIKAIKENAEKANFKNTIVALEKCGKQLDIVAEIFFNLNSAETNDKIQEFSLLRGCLKVQTGLQACELFLNLFNIHQILYPLFLQL